MLVALVAVVGGAAAVHAQTRAAVGDTTVVRMIGDDAGYRLEPRVVRIANGAAVRFVVVSGAPHNVSFDDTLPPDLKSRLQANMTRTLSDLSGPLMMSRGESYTVSFAGLPGGTYGYHCMPHLALGERGQIIVAGPPAGAGAPVPAAPANLAPATSIGLTGTNNYQGAIRDALTALGRVAPGTLGERAGVPLAVDRFLRNLVTAEEAYFADSSRYGNNFDEIRSSSGAASLSLNVPGNAEPLILTAGPGYWFAILRVNRGACAIAVNVPNPLVEKAAEAVPVCRLIGQQSGTTPGS
ncbi:MAG TPA: plastocyanin/azurin family copper-binding protein [Gemmatimonadaceae bacterium]|nr:plastocyanin/azurin family copper-binding protein [Gemmatimonadaceae bacterium]